MTRSTDFVSVNAPVSDEVVQAIRDLDNNSLALRLHFTVHHLSRWITPIHDRNKLERSRHYGEPTVRDLLLLMRENEQFIYPRMWVVANEKDPNMDQIPPYVPNASVVMADRNWATVELMGGFRRLRQSTCGLLRQIPDAAWQRKGYSRVHENATLRQLAEQLAEHDYRVLRAMDATLWDSGARDGIAEIQTASIDELLQLVPTSLKI
ncbi:MAG: hypothetical protein M9953_02415 [Thermomicrobiales bacterium]|nr:hypothetical protein [Thermomicrobiales bacterium]MCO5217884.1 hypothetical protein [Thermomicrobiales bacterium]MCO5224167.1 hypothetical protein [Thermomicrobiales bacterium]MCO5227123.1 hypothetical protein [Thermomicrobiales bacterium]